jgi:hypothetical protein
MAQHVHRIWYFLPSPPESLRYNGIIYGEGEVKADSHQLHIDYNQPRMFPKFDVLNSAKHQNKGHILRKDRENRLARENVV